jgi:hypothetical protein
MNKVILCLLALASIDAHSISVSEIQRLAIERSSSLSAQEMEERALHYDSKQKSKWQNPQMMGQFGTLKYGTTEVSTTEISLTQAIPLSDKFSLKRDMAQVASGMQKSQNEYFKNWVSHQAILAGWKVHVTQELFNHGRERARRIRLVQQYLETRPRVSVKHRVEHSIISSILMQLEKMQDQKKLDLQMAQNDLEFWIGKKVEASEIAFVIPEISQVVSNFQLNTLSDLELIQAQNKLKITSLEREIAVKEKRPDLFVGGGYRVENVERKNHFTYGILGITIPIWDTGSNRVEASKVREMRDQKNLEEAERRLTMKHKNQIDLVLTSLEQFKRFPTKFIQSNERSIRDAESGFKQGVLDVNTFLQAETQSHEVIDQVFMSWLSYLENLSTLQLMRNESLFWGTK